MSTMTQQPPGAAPRPPTKRPARSRHRIPIDVNGKHGSAWGTFNAAGVLFTSGVVGGLVHARWLWPLALGFGFLGMCGALLVAVTKDEQKAPPYTWEALLYRGACWVAGAGWLTWVLATFPAIAVMGLALVGGAVVFGTLAPLASRRRRKNQPRKSGDPVTRDELGEQWVARIKRKANLDVRVLNIEAWEERAGYTVDVDMRGVSWRKLRPFIEDLAADLRLPVGCGVSIEPGINRGRALIYVTTKNVLGEERYLPRDYTPATVLAGLFLGWARDAATLVGDIRQATWLLVGKKGSGKTTQLNALMAGLTRCTDCIVVVIDLNRGGYGVPWAQAWMEERAPQPAIEWLAGDPEEALKLAKAMFAVALGRKRRSGKLKRLFNTTLMPIGNGVPQLVNGTAVTLPPEVVIVVDEGREIFGVASRFRELRDTLMQIEALARDAGINLIITALDGTIQSVDTFVKKQCEQRICLPVADDAEIAYVLDWNSGFKTEDMPGPGAGLARLDGVTAPVPYRAPNMLPDQVDECSVAVAGLRPAFTTEDIADIDSVLGAGVFADRWERAKYLFDDPDEEEGSGMDEHGESSAGREQEQPKPVGDLASSRAGMDEAVAAARAIAEAAEAKRSAAREPDPGAEARAEIERLNAAWSLPEYEPPAEKSETNARDRAFELLRLAGPDGASPSEVAEQLKKDGFRTVRQTVWKWFDDEIKSGLVRKLDYGRYRHRDAAS